jgi:hypothetical protein
MVGFVESVPNLGMGAWVGPSTGVHSGPLVS